MKKLLATKLLALSLILASSYGYAIDATITKTDSPDIIIVVNNGTGLAQFGLISSDFPSGTGNKTKTLQGIDWSTTSYPNNTGETVELCYYRPYNSNPVSCTAILPNSSGTLTTYNGQSFGNGARVINSPPCAGRPAAGLSRRQRHCDLPLQLLATLAGRHAVCLPHGAPLRQSAVLWQAEPKVFRQRAVMYVKYESFRIDTSQRHAHREQPWSVSLPTHPCPAAA